MVTQQMISVDDIAVPAKDRAADVETLRDRLDSINDKAEIALAVAVIALLLILLATGERK
jgi:hypothetical protein